MRMPDFRNDRLRPGRAPRRPAAPDLRDRRGELHPRAALPDARHARLARRALAHPRLPAATRRPSRPTARTTGETRTPATRRNLLGFKDGTANPSAADPALMDELVWVGEGQGEPDWAVGWHVHGRPHDPDVRRALGPHRARRAGGRSSAGPSGPARRSARPARRTTRPTATTRTASGSRSTPTSGWPTRGRPRPQPSRILRRGYSFSRGFDGAGLLDEGLFFVAFQRDLEQGFVTVQDRLAGEPLEEYIQPVGGGYFFAPPGLERPDAISAASLLA